MDMFNAMLSMVRRHVWLMINVQQVTKDCFAVNVILAIIKPLVVNVTPVRLT
jgi:hypothetical protein